MNVTDDRTINLVRMAEYVERVLPLLRLAHWDVTVVEELPDDEQAEAQIWYSRNCLIARIRFADRHFQQAEREQRATVAHELTHLHLADMDFAAIDTREYLDPTSRDWVRERWQLVMERATDALGRVIAQWLPPIDMSA